MNFSFAATSGVEFKKSRLYRESQKLVKKAKRLYAAYNSLQEVKRISKHFSSYFQPVVASKSSELKGAHKIRHDVYCKELGLFDATGVDYEADSYDEYATQCLIEHERTGSYAGTVRLIMPDSDKQILPIEKEATQYITDKRYLPSNFNRDEVCEISRIAIPKEFRKRKVDKYAGAAYAVINEETYSEIELRCFPLIAVGLYMSTAALALKKGKKHAFFMVEPRLAKSMRYIGIKLVKIGEEFEYVGTRAPYYINNEDFLNHLSPSFKFMMNQFMKKID